MPRYIFRLLLLFVLPFSGINCDRDRKMPGWDYFPDMFYSTAYETFTKNPNFADGMTMRTPAEGTIPQGYIPFEYNNDPESRLKAGRELQNPFTANEDNLIRGKTVFNTFCTGCHGIEGDGNGNLYTSGLYIMKPAVLSRDKALALKDGEIYHTITLGLRVMGSHASQIQADDRWKIVLYIRKLQKDASKSQLP